MSIIIAVDLHESGSGFQIVADIDGECKAYPEAITDIMDAMDKALTMQAAIAQETGIKIPDKDVRVTQRAIEYNGWTTRDNLKVYGSMQTGKLKPQN
jgi:hypothetical protein